MDNTYPDSGNFICPDYSHEWSATTQSTEMEEEKIYKDAHGKFLIDGNTVAANSVNFIIILVLFISCAMRYR
jgi:uncharacterized Zn ribbon protein